LIQVWIFKFLPKKIIFKQLVILYKYDIIRYIKMYITSLDINDFEITINPNDMEIIKEISPTISTYNVEKIIDPNSLNLNLKVPGDDETIKKIQAILLLLLAGYYYGKTNQNILNLVLPDKNYE